MISYICTRPPHASFTAAKQDHTPYSHLQTGPHPILPPSNTPHPISPHDHTPYSHLQTRHIQYPHMWCFTCWLWTTRSFTSLKKGCSEVMTILLLNCPKASVTSPSTANKHARSHRSGDKKEMGQCSKGQACAVVSQLIPTQS